MKRDQMILAQEQFYNLNCYETQLNNNVLVVGASGAGKTRSIVIPNLLQAYGSYIVSDPKGNLYQQYKNYLEQEGYVVKKIDFTDPMNSSHYNFFRYIRNTQDIVKIAHMLVYAQDNERTHMDPFWNEADQLLIQALIAYLKEEWGEEDQNLHRLLQLVELCQSSGDMNMSRNPVDILFEDLRKKNRDSYAVSTYNKFRVATNKTLRSILITVNAQVGRFDTPEISELTRMDDIDFPSLGERKTAVFVVVSDTDRSLDPLVNLFFTQAMNELCRYADKECKNNCLKVPVRFIMDDFATNCKIEDFPRMIASIRSRNISAMILIQAESQLKECFGYDAMTIIGNCDTYVYLGGNDTKTARAVAERCDVPVKKILNMPVGTNWIFRRGQSPINGVNFNLNQYLEEKGLRERSEQGEEQKKWEIQV